MNNSTTITGLTYALVLLIGGLIGYIKVGSVTSLITSSIATVLMLFSMVLAMRGNPLGLRTANIVTLLLLAFFAYRWWLTGAMIPAGAMVFVSLLVLFIFVTTGSSRKE